MIDTNDQKISTDILAERHFNQLHRESGIGVDVILERGYKTIRGKQPLEVEGFSKNQRRPPGILMPGIGVDGKPIFPVYKPDDPRMNSSERNPKPVKYESPLNSVLRINTHPRCIANLKNPNIPLFVTEGTKKLDCLVSCNLCAISLNGVFGFKGKNEFNASTFLADWEFIALKGRETYLTFDSDIVTKSQVNSALSRLQGILINKGAIVKIVILPEPDSGGKTGVDDYLASGHTVDDLFRLATNKIPGISDDNVPLDRTQYGVYEGQYYRIVNKSGLKVKTPLSNFIANIIDEEIIDDGIEAKRQFTIEGELASGGELPPVTMPSSDFVGMGWVLDNWGSDAIIYAGNGTKDHLRTAIQLNRNGHKPRCVYGHTGWRELGNKRVYLTPSGAIGSDIPVTVDLGHFKETGYNLPFDNEIPVDQAVGKSLEFLGIGPDNVTFPIWALMFLAPLTEILNPPFVLWYLGHTGSMKSTVTSLALCHFGDFTELSLPLSWGHGSTAKGLSKSLSVLKDFPTIIDDWAPAPSGQEQRRLEQKAEDVIRAIGNRAISTKLCADSSFQRSYYPRGVVASSGEQLPPGESLAARIFVADIERKDIDFIKLSAAQRESNYYKYAMAAYIKWVAQNYDHLKGTLPIMFYDCRDRVLQDDTHARLPVAVSCLYIAVDTAMRFMEDIGVIEEKQGHEYTERAWETFTQLAAKHALVVDQERPARKFLDAFRTLYSQDRFVFIDRDSASPEESGYSDKKTIKPPYSFAGWADDTTYYVLPAAVHREITDFYKLTQSFTIKSIEVWKDLQRLGYLSQSSSDPRHPGQINIRVGATKKINKWVVPIKKSIIDEDS